MPFRLPSLRIPLAFVFAFLLANGPSASAQELDSSLEGGFPTYIGPVRTVHPNYRIFSLTPEGYQFKVTGMDWMANGDLALVTIQDTVFPAGGGGKGEVYLLKGAREATSNAIAVQRIYSGFNVPLGLAVADDGIYVSDFDGLQKLVDPDAEGRARALRKITAYPGNSYSGFGLWNANVIHSGGRFYTALGAYHFVDSISHGGACKPVPDRGTIHSTDLAGNEELLGSGLREPNGLVVSADGELFATDNDGEWVPSNKMVHIRKDSFYGMCMGTRWDAGLVHSRPALWIPKPLRSPGQPALIRSGIYRDQMVVGDYALLTLSRMFLEKVEGGYQGALFPFSGGLISGALRLAADDRGNLYLGEMEIISSGGWWYGDPKYRETHVGYGLQKMMHTGDSAFEMLAIRATAKGFAVEFTAPAGAAAGDPAQYRIRQWRYEPTFKYGGPMLDLETLRAAKAVVSGDGGTVTLDIPGLKADRVVHIQLHKDFRSAAGKAPWTYEAWYTLNAIPGDPNGALPARTLAPEKAFTLVRGRMGGISIRIALREKYSFRVCDLKGKPVLSASGSEPKEFHLNAALPGRVYSLILDAGNKSHRGLIRAF